jgi:thiol-disulfide isomerase/thioredoxin
MARIVNVLRVMNRALLIGAALAASVASPVTAAKLGDPAAPLTIKNWVKGKPVDVTDGKNVYVVEFWATWCGPCRTSIPHLTEVQKKFRDKGVIFVGVSDEDVEKVKPFVEKMGDKMEYTVACDDERKTSQGYMAAYGQNGIPTAFVVGKNGKVLWFGHPMAELEETLEQVLEGKYDLAAAAKRDAARAMTAEYKALSAEGDPKAKALGRELLKNAGDDVEALQQFAFTIAADARNEHRDFALANEALDKAEAKAGKDNPGLLGTRAIALFESGKQEDGLALAKKAVRLAKDDRERSTYERFVSVMESRMKAGAKGSSKKSE